MNDNEQRTLFRLTVTVLWVSAGVVCLFAAAELDMFGLDDPGVREGFALFCATTLVLFLDYIDRNGPKV